MADSSRLTATDNQADGATHTEPNSSRSVLLKRNPHLRDSSATSSPAGFGPLGTRQFLHKQLMTPGSATSASSFEEGASFDGFSDAGTPASEQKLLGVHNNAETVTHRSVSKQPTKRLSSPSRESLARRLMGTATNQHGMLPDDESVTTSQDNEVLPTGMLSSIVVKTVTSISVPMGEASAAASVPLSPRSAKVTRRIVASPRKTLRRVVVRRTGADGKVHEEVQYVDAEGQVVQGGDFFNAEADEAVTTSTSSAGRTTVTRRIVTPAKLTRRVLRRTGADGQVHEQVQYLDVDGNVVQTEGDSDAVSSTGNTVVTRRTVTPGKTIRRVLVRRTGADGQTHEEVQFLDADGNAVQSDGSELVKTSSFSSVSGPSSSSGRTVVTRRVVSPGQTLKRVVIRRRGADGELHEEVQYVDADGNVVSTEGGEVSKTGSFSAATSSDAAGGHKVTRRVIRRMLVRKDGTRVPVEQVVDADGQVIEGEGGSLVSVGSFTGSVSSVTSDNSTSSRRTVTRRVVASPGKVVRRTVVHTAGSSSGADSEDDVQSVDGDVDLASSGSFTTRTVTTQSTPGRRIITRRVVTPQRVVRRMVVRKGTAGSSAEAGVEDDLDIDAEFVQSEGTGSSDESVGGSSRGGSTRGGYSVSDRIVIPGSETRRLVSRTVASSAQPQDVTTSNQSQMTTVVTEPQEGSTSPEATKKIGLTPGVIWDYFTKEEGGDSTPEQPTEDNQAVESEEKAAIPDTSRTSTTTNTVTSGSTDVVFGGQEAPKVTPVATVAGAAIVTSTVVDSSKSLDEDEDEFMTPQASYDVEEVPQVNAAESMESLSDEKLPVEAASAAASFEAPDVVGEETRTATSDEITTGSSVDSPHNDALRSAVVGGVAGATLATAAVVHSSVAPKNEPAQHQPDAVEDEVSEPVASAIPSDAPVPVSPRHARRSSGGGFWGFFGKEEAAPVDSVVTKPTEVKELKDTNPDVEPQALILEAHVDEDAPVGGSDSTATVVMSTATEGVATATIVEPNAEVALPSKSEEVIESAPVVGATTGAVTAAALADSHQPGETTSESAPNVVVATTTTTETAEEESQGGFWGFFGKSEPKKPRAVSSEAQPEEVEKVEEVPTVEAPAAPSAVVTSSHSVDEAQQEPSAAHKGEADSPGTATFDEINASEDLEEEKTPVGSIVDAHADVVDVPEPKSAAETVTSPESPRDTDALQTAALAAATDAVVVGVLETKEPHSQLAAHIPTSEGGELPIDEKSAAPVDIAAPDVTPLVVTSTQTTTVTMEESESPSDIPHRKTGRSIWKFWGGDKPKSPLSEEEKLKEEEERLVGAAAVPVVTTSVNSEQQTSTTDAVGHTPVLSPSEARQFWRQQDQQNPTQLSYAAAEGATYGLESKFEPMSAADKLRSPVACSQVAVVESPRDNAMAAGILVTSVTTTTVEEEEKFESGHLHRSVPAVDAVDIAVVTDSQQPVERESVEREEPNDQKPAAAVVQIEETRRSIPSDATPTHFGAAAAPQQKQIRDSERRTTVLIDGAEPDIELDEHYVEIESPRPSHGLNDEDAWAVTPCSLAWSHLRLNRKSWKTGTSPSGSTEVVLDDVSGSLKSGEFLVITGPSKDESLALLSCLAGYQDAMEGNVTVNGRQWNEKMNRYVAYVMREDLFYETLTVHEHLVLQAQLRMRRTHSDAMCLERVERVMEDMGLSDCRDKLIGGGISLRGITRGERKLLALATALLTNPSIVLVEEPTDGLDTFSAEKIVAKLRWLAFEKRLTVAVTLHHPSSHFYGLFDVLYLVADASCVYDGKAADCVAYFSTIGYQCPEFMSPMDYFMLQMVVGDRASDDEGVARVDMLKRAWANRNAAVYADNAARAAAASEDAVVNDYDHKHRYYHMGCCGQLWLLWTRHVRRLSRYGFVFWWHLLAALLIGVVFGLVYLQLDLNDQKGIQNFSGCFFYVVVVLMLFIAYRTFVFMPRETAIALRERQEYRGGWYHLLCWYVTKLVAELPALIILSIALFVPVFLLVGIGHGFKLYVYMQIVLVLAGWAAIGLGFLTLGVLRHVTLALIVYAVLLVLFVAFGGLLINVTDIPDWLVWLHYISPVKYSYEALMKLFWKRVDSIDCDWTVEGCVALTGDGVLQYYSMENRSALGDSLILLAICFAFFFFAFWFLLALANKRVSGLQWRYDWSFKGALGSAQQRIVNATTSEKHATTRSSVHRVVERKSQHSSSAAEAENCYIRVETPRVGAHGVCDAPAITLGWSSLWLKAQSDKKTKNDQQYLLSDASGSAKCGELVLVTGPSSESNVALLESLGGLQKRLKGKVTLNGAVSGPQKIAERAAYVARDDLFYETLTVEEHLQFQAQLVVGKSSGCCGLSCAGELEAERVEMVLDELELASKRHMLIHYLSAADSKMLAIATALLTNPSVLLVEEPTRGMDFYSSQRVVLKLRQLARGGRTVLVTMTHPSSHLYALFDALYLLAGGAAVYHGKVREAVPYFASLGYPCPQYMSPVDYFIRQVSVGDAGQATLFKEAWSTRYSELCLADNGDEQEDEQSAGVHRRRVGCCGQLSLLFQRHVLRLARYRAVFGWHALWMIVLGVIFGLIFLQLDLDEQQDIQNWAGAFFFLVVLQMLVNAYRTFVFLPREMAVAEREHRSGRYYMACWYLTKVFTELPAMMVLSILLFVPAYLLIGIGHGFKLYFFMQLVMWLAAWSAAGMASLLLGLFRRVRVVLIVYMLLLILFVVFGGLLINVDDVPDYLIWLHYISPVKYGYEALMKLFWGRIAFLACGGGDGSGSGSVAFAGTVGDDYAFSQSGSGSFADDDGCIAHSGDEVLSHYSMESRDARSDSIILLDLTVLYFFVGYALLSLRWRQYKTRQRHSTQNAIDN
ncbi:hypothetical protein PF008_g18917 [Phytophthora fragariae]|uniref:ABC transporter domain-containing protein n=1 Tax=Phytophthora fragariae TaxID=53985 RepID=A0A6G0R482_9STRA|nr:hypothetical protein PF008_g18917 [Phytophthora fragariae]